MPIVPMGFVSEAEIAAEVNKVIRELGPNVVRVRYNTGEDTGGDPALYFRIILTDNAARREFVMDTVEPIERLLMERLYPYSRWGLIPYFSYRSESEEAELKSPAWS